jgi:hypothetical protein
LRAAADEAGGVAAVDVALVARPRETHAAGVVVVWRGSIGR